MSRKLGFASEGASFSRHARPFVVVICFKVNRLTVWTCPGACGCMFPDLTFVALLQCGCMTAFQRRLIITSSLTCECCSFPLINVVMTSHCVYACVCLCYPCTTPSNVVHFFPIRVTGGELFEDIVAREYYSEADAR